MSSIGIAVLAAVLPCVAAAQKPDFSGTWKLDVSASEFGVLPAPSSRLQEIEHREPEIAMKVVEVRGQGGEVRSTFRFVTGGEESVNTVRGGTMKSILKWDEERLMFDTRGSTNGMEFQARDSWRLAEGGKVLLIERALSNAAGETHQKLRFDKQ